MLTVHYISLLRKLLNADGGPVKIFFKWMVLGLSKIHKNYYYVHQNKVMTENWIWLLDYAT